MSWFDHGVKWDAQWHFEYAAAMYLAWSSGENIFKSSDDQSEKGSAESEVYSLKNLRWQVRSTNQFIFFISFKKGERMIFPNSMMQWLRVTVANEKNLPNN